MKFEEYMYRQDAGNKEARHAKSKEYYINKLKDMGEDEKKLNKMSIAELGKLHAEKKKK